MILNDNTCNWWFKILNEKNYKLKLKHKFVCTEWYLTRAPRGTDRSPEYNEHFCYKLDSSVKK